MKKAIQILIVDDHKLFRKALTLLINGFRYPIKIREAGNGQEALLRLSEEPADIVLLDIQMPVMNGIETLRAIKSGITKTKVIILTQFLERALMMFALKKGANGFLFKGCDPEELKLAFTTVISKGYYFNEEALELYGEVIRDDTTLSKMDITAREFQILALLKDGKSNKELSAVLGLTLRTVESYRKKLIKKTNSRNTVDLVSFAYRTGLLANP